jgi:hypothetical protein
MIERTADWLRVVDPSPSDDKVQKRIAAVRELITEFDSADDHFATLAGIDNAICGAPVENAQDQALAERLIRVVRTHQPSFPSSENALELRIVCALIIGEMMARRNKPDEPPGDKPVLFALAVTSAHGLVKRTEERSLRAVVDDLVLTAKRTLEEAATARRESQAVNYKPFDSEKVTAAPGLPDFIKAVVPAIKRVLNSLESQLHVMREEVDMLWWFINESSVLKEDKLPLMKPFAAALASGLELGSQVQLPPLHTVRRLVLHAIHRGRAPDALQAQPLDKIVDDWDSTLIQSLAPTDTTAIEIVRKFPRLAPLHWLGLRIQESGGGQGWIEELQRKTGLTSSSAFTPEQIGVQTLDEQALLRMYAKE